MTRKKFEALVKDVLKKLPKKFKEKLENVDVVIEPGLDKKSSKLLGLYRGVPLEARTHCYGIVLPDKITLYQRSIESECKAHGLDVRREVKNVIQHEIAHHFGISDRRLRDLGVY
jgi:predicted Zn-dependent protease with MMP-like domain